MTDLEWVLLRHFSKGERWGDPEKMDSNFVIKLDSFRGEIAKPFVLTVEAYAKDGHSENSYHYKGLACDGRFIDPVTRQALPLIEQVMIALKAPFNGVGIYTYHQNGPFLHFDDRNSAERKIWVCRSKGVYENLTPEFLRWALNLPGGVIG